MYGIHQNPITSLAAPAIDKQVRLQGSYKLKILLHICANTDDELKDIRFLNEK